MHVDTDAEYMTPPQFSSYWHSRRQSVWEPLHGEYVTDCDTPFKGGAALATTHSSVSTATGVKSAMSTGYDEGIPLGDENVVGLSVGLEGARDGAPVCMHWGFTSTNDTTLLLTGETLPEFVDAVHARKEHWFWDCLTLKLGPRYTMPVQFADLELVSAAQASAHTAIQFAFAGTVTTPPTCSLSLQFSAPCS